MKLDGVTLLDKCAAGVRLPKRGPCPECGAQSNEPCFKKSAEDQAEFDRMRANLVNLLDRCNAIDLWLCNWDLPFSDDDEWQGDLKLWRETRVAALNPQQREPQP